MAAGSTGPIASLKSLLLKMAIGLGLIYLGLFIFTTEQIAYYYPYADDPTIYIQSDEYVYHYAACREWARDTAREEGSARAGVFACGRKCQYSEAQEQYLCENISEREPLYETQENMTPQMILSM